MRIELHPAAEEELYKAAAWYDDQRQGLGDDLLIEMTRWLDAIAEEPMLWPTWPGAPNLSPPIRRALTDRFPYAVAYQVHPGHISILAFAHTSRKPFYWAERAKR